MSDVVNGEKGEKAPSKLGTMKPYKLRALKIYHTTQTLANTEMRYRQVYDESETTYLYAELSLYNKLFDEEDWTIKFQFKVYDSWNKEVVTISKDLLVAKDLNILYLREGWGTATSGFWKKGNYRWEAWVDGEKLAEITVYIVKEGQVDTDKNPYFQIESIRFFEAPFEGLQGKPPKYMSQFNHKNIRYLWAELVGKNLLKKEDRWPCQLFFNFFYDTGELKGQQERLVIVNSTDETIKADIGWGSKTAAACWFKDTYRLEVVFMDTLIASVPFTVDETDIECTLPSMPLVSASRGVLPTRVDSGDDTLEQLLEELDEMIGLASIKAQINEFAHYLKFLKLRRDKGFDESKNPGLHAVFKGNPGTGKTTVARMLGRIYKRLGLLSKGHISEVDRADLIGKYIGQTAPAVKEAIAKARGGILFVDEAYSLYRANDPTSNDFGREAIEILIKEMSDGPGDLAIICAGYPSEMDVFLESNPGLRSRFHLTYDFPDYLPQELVEIGELAAKKRSVKFAADAQRRFHLGLVEAYRRRDRTFGNARHVFGLVDRAKMNLGLRLMKHRDPGALGEEELSTIQFADVERMFLGARGALAEIPVDEELLAEARTELAQLVGLDAIKREIDELVKLVRFYRETRKSLNKMFSLHAVFTGNPGTGKTTVARILARIYKALGVLERGHLVECDREALVAGYIGQTAIKTAKLVEQAMGGVLFVDEAYALVQPYENDFGSEALETLLKRMEDRRGELAVIMAGYTGPMREFIASNPGLRSRFDRFLHFPDYDALELQAIAMSILQRDDVVADEGARAALLAACEALHRQRSESFGNAREVRKLVEVVVRAQHLRLSSLPRDARTPELLRTLTAEDVAAWSATQGDLPSTPAREIGFLNKPDKPDKPDKS